jgi:hypothetical protein
MEKKEQYERVRIKKKDALDGLTGIDCSEDSFRESSPDSGGDLGGL